MKDKEVFYKEVREMVEEHYQDRASVSMHDISKNNGLVKKGLCVTLNGSNCGPTVYLDDFYNDLENGREVSDIKSAILDILEKTTVDEAMDMSFFMDYEAICDKICFRLVGSERNEEALKNVPHRMIEDLAVTYYVSLEAMGIEGSIAIKNEYLKMWDVNEEDLFEAALDNTPRIHPANIVPMSRFIAQRTGDPALEDIAPSDGFIIGSNEKYLYGAAVILYPGLLKEVADRMGGNFYIIPSSVNEVIFLRDTFFLKDPGELMSMIRSVNSSCVLPEEVLSDSLYYYDRTDENNVKKVEQVKDTMLL